ncbi:MAG TPA: hypothetical protein VF103_05785 [Polyangiaceae bacterium]
MTNGPTSVLPPQATISSSAALIKSVLHLPAFLTLGSMNTGSTRSDGSRAVGPRAICPSCPDRHLEISDDRVLATAIVAGVAAAGVGAVVILNKPSRTDRNPLLPEFHLRVGKTAGAVARWRF